MLKKALLNFIFAGLMIGMHGAFCAPVNVVFLAGQGSAIPGEIFFSIKKEIEARSSAVVSKADFDGAFHADEVVVAFGVEGARAAAKLDPRIPVLCVFVPEKTFDEIGHAHKMFSAIYIDQPLKRQMNLIRLVFPEKRRVGVLLGPNSSAQLASLQQAAAGAGLVLTSGTVATQSELFFSVEKVLKGSDVMLAVPDPLVYNGTTISGILLTAFRYHVPLVGFSPSYERAGALVALFSSIRQIGWQVAEAITKFSNTGALPPPEFPAYFKVGVNRYVARSMEIEIQDEATFEEKLSHMEGAP